MKYRVMSWIAVEPETEPIEDYKEAQADIAQAEEMQPENKYELQHWCEKHQEWTRMLEPA